MKGVACEEDLRVEIGHGVTLGGFSVHLGARPVRAQEPILNRMAFKFENKAAIVTANVDKCRITARDLGIRSIPHACDFQKRKRDPTLLWGLQSEWVLSEALMQATR